MKYRQIAEKLRIQRGVGRPDKVSTRPRDKTSGRYLDADNPTLIELDQWDQVDMPSLLADGAIEPYVEEAING